MHDCWCKFNTIASVPKNAPLPKILQFCDCTLYFFLEQNTSRCHFFRLRFFARRVTKTPVPRKCVRAKKSVCAVGEIISIVLAEWVRVDRLDFDCLCARRGAQSEIGQCKARARGTILGKIAFCHHFRAFYRRLISWSRQRNSQFARREKWAQAAAAAQKRVRVFVLSLFWCVFNSLVHCWFTTLSKKHRSRQGIGENAGKTNNVWLWKMLCAHLPQFFAPVHRKSSGAAAIKI